MRRDLERIKAIPICEYLERKGITVPAHGNICAFWRGDKNPSVSIDRTGNRWYDHGTGKGGSVIDLEMAIENCGFKQAVENLDSGTHTIVVHSSPLQSERKPAIIIDDVRFLQHPALLGYLNSRGISSGLASIYCKEIHFHLERKPEARYFAIGFQQKGRGWELRNQCCKIATRKDYSYVNCKGSHLAVFEGFMDFLSYMEFPDSIFPKRSPENCLILNSVAIADRMLKDLKAGKLGPISTACLYLDSDEAGRRTSAKIERELEAMGIRVLEDGGARLSKFGKDVKDINDALIRYQQQLPDEKDIR